MESVFDIFDPLILLSNQLFEVFLEEVRLLARGQMLDILWVLYRLAIFPYLQVGIPPVHDEPEILGESGSN